MAISPNKINEKFLQEVDAFEKHFDELIIQSKPQFGRIYLPIPSVFTLDHLEAIKKRYIAVGWKDVHVRYAQSTGEQLDICFVI